MQQNAKELSASRALLHPLKIAVIRNSPASRQTAWCWASFMLRFGAFLRIKSPMCRSFFYAVLTYVPYKIGKLQIQGFSEPTTPNKIKQSYHITQKAARSRPRAAFLRGKLGRRQDFSKK